MKKVKPYIIGAVFMAILQIAIHVWTMPKSPSEEYIMIPRTLGEPGRTLRMDWTEGAWSVADKHGITKDWGVTRGCGYTSFPDKLKQSKDNSHPVHNNTVEAAHVSPDGPEIPPSWERLAVSGTTKAEYKELGRRCSCHCFESEWMPMKVEEIQ